MELVALPNDEEAAPGEVTATATPPSNQAAANSAHSSPPRTAADAPARTRGTCTWTSLKASCRPAQIAFCCSGPCCCGCCCCCAPCFGEGDAQPRCCRRHRRRLLCVRKGCLSGDRAFKVFIGLVSATNGFSASDWSWGLFIMFTRVFAGLMILDWIVKCFSHFVLAWDRYTKEGNEGGGTGEKAMLASPPVRAARACLDTWWLEEEKEGKGGLAKEKGDAERKHTTQHATATPMSSRVLALASLLAALILPFLLSANIMAAAPYLADSLPGETTAVWGTAFLAPTAHPTASPVTASVKFFDWAFGDLAPCSLLLGSVLYAPSKVRKRTVLPLCVYV